MISAENEGCNKKTRDGLPNALDFWDVEKNIKQRVHSAKKLGIFLDYDGTLTPIVRDPNKSFISEKMRSLVAKLSIQDGTDVAIVSGRSISKLQQFLKLDTLYLSGSHGAEVLFPGIPNNSVGIPMMEVDNLGTLQLAQQEVEGVLVSFPGCHIEDNKFVFSVHFRNARFQLLPTLQRTVKELELKEELIAIATRLNLRVERGKKVFEIKPEGSWDKGVAVLWLIRQVVEQDTIAKTNIWEDESATADDREEDTSDSNQVYYDHLQTERSGPPFFFYLGDDRADERAFAALKANYPNQSLGVLVASKPRKTEASCCLKDTNEVYNFLRLLLRDKGDVLSHIVKAEVW